VRACLVLGHLLFMANRAVDLAGDLVAGALVAGVDAGMALRTGDLRVHRMFELVPVHEERATIRRLEVLVAVAHETVLIGYALSVEYLADLVRLVAIHADGNRFRLLFPKRAVDHLPMDLLDFGMALQAGRHDVAVGDGGLRIGMRQDLVRGMAGNAGGAAAEPLLEKTLAVDALGIVFQNMVFRNIPLLLDLRTLAVAGTADKRNPKRRHVGVAILHG